MWSPRLTFDRDPAPRIGQASLMAATVQRGGLFLLEWARKGGKYPPSGPVPQIRWKFGT